MKASNLSKELVTSYNTFHDLIIPMLALGQLAVAGFGAYCSSYINNRLGPRKSMTFLIRHILSGVLFFILAAAGRKLRWPTRKEMPFLLITGVLGIFLKAQLTSKCRSVTTPYYLSLWQPMLPVFVGIASIWLGLEGSSPRKTVGMIICMLAVASFVIVRNYDKEDWFEYNYWYVAQIIVPGVATITTKQAVGASGSSLYNIGFWFTVFGILPAFFYYSCQYRLDDKDSPYLTYQYVLDLMDCGGIFCTAVVTDTFNLVCLMYIAKTGQASKAAVYSTLQATWTILIGIVRQEYENYVYPYLFFIYIGYTFINYDKKKAAEKAKKAKIRVRFLRKVEQDFEVGKKERYITVEKELTGDDYLVDMIEDELRATMDPKDVGQRVRIRHYENHVPDTAEEVRVPLEDEERSINFERAKTEVEPLHTGINAELSDDESEVNGRSTIQSNT